MPVVGKNRVPPGCKQAIGRVRSGHVDLVLVERPVQQPQVHGSSNAVPRNTVNRFNRRRPSGRVRNSYPTPNLHFRDCAEDRSCRPKGWASSLRTTIAKLSLKPRGGSHLRWNCFSYAASTVRNTSPGPARAALQYGRQRRAGVFGIQIDFALHE